MNIALALFRQEQGNIGITHYASVGEHETPHDLSSVQTAAQPRLKQGSERCCVGNVIRRRPCASASFDRCSFRSFHRPPQLPLFVDSPRYRYGKLSSSGRYQRARFSASLEGIHDRGSRSRAMSHSRHYMTVVRTRHQPGQVCTQLVANLNQIDASCRSRLLPSMFATNQFDVGTS